MPLRKIPFVNGCYYHIYNRSVAKGQIYSTANHYKRFLNTLLYYQLASIPIRFSLSNPKIHLLNYKNKLVDLICFCLMPNHFHLLFKQNQDGGITNFMANLSNSYTRYFNTKDQRVGPLFQGEFKAVLIDDDEYLIHLSRYIHLNPLVGHLVKNLTAYKWSSYPEYIGLTKTNYCVKK